jgi:hypothetical protein
MADPVMAAPEIPEIPEIPEDPEIARNETPG